ncbi:unnamed protein product [Diplocarpon coronariae]
MSTRHPHAARETSYRFGRPATALKRSAEQAGRCEAGSLDTLLSYGGDVITYTFSALYHAFLPGGSATEVGASGEAIQRENRLYLRTALVSASWACVQIDGEYKRWRDRCPGALAVMASESSQGINIQYTNIQD